MINFLSRFVEGSYVLDKHKKKCGPGGILGYHSILVKLLNDCSCSDVIGRLLMAPVEL